MVNVTLLPSDTAPPPLIPVPAVTVSELLTRPAFGNPVQLVNVPDVGVPRTGVTNVGLVERTLFPEPVELVTPVPPWATGIVVNPVPILPAVNAPTPVIPVYDPDIWALATVPLDKLLAFSDVK